MRALLLIAEGFGVGVTPSHDPFETAGTETLQRIVRALPDLCLPALNALGLGEVLAGRIFDPAPANLRGCYGRMRPLSVESDPVSMLWELAGVVSTEPFLHGPALHRGFLSALAEEAPFFSTGQPATDEGLKAALKAVATTEPNGLPLLLAGPGSRVWVAAHEADLPFSRLHEICRAARRLGNAHRLAAVRAIPLTGAPDHWKPAGGDHTYALPPSQTVFNALAESGLPVESVGDAGVHLAFSGITRDYPAATNAEVFNLLDELWHQRPQDGAIVATLPDFAALGAGQDAGPFGEALQRLDRWIARFIDAMDMDDLLILAGTAGSHPDHPGPLREEVPVLLRYDGRGGPLGLRPGLTDVAATLAAFFELTWPGSEPLTTFHRAHG